uniref:Uncharacterized protein n=1 Tax=Rhizophora mucronata TaxID=61149 RepID=A0A2P2Q2S6_RHIMU
MTYFFFTDTLHPVSSAGRSASCFQRTVQEVFLRRPW